MNPKKMFKVFNANLTKCSNVLYLKLQGSSTIYVKVLKNYQKNIIYLPNHRIPTHMNISYSFTFDRECSMFELKTVSRLNIILSLLACSIVGIPNLGVTNDNVRQTPL